MPLEEQIAQITDPHEFTRLCNSILTALHDTDFQIIDGTRGDEGNDGYISSKKRIIAIYCPIKPERRTDADYLKKIRDDIKKAQRLKGLWQSRSGALDIPYPSKAKQPSDNKNEKSSRPSPLRTIKLVLIIVSVSRVIKFVKDAV